MSAFITMLIISTFLASVPGNVAIIQYLKEKPLGRQTILDTVYKDFFTCNLIAIIFHGISICYVNTGDLLLQCHDNHKVCLNDLFIVIDHTF